VASPEIAGLSKKGRAQLLTSKRRLSSGFLRSSEIYTSRPALEVGGVTLTYGQLRARAGVIAAAILRAHITDGPPLTAVFAYRSPTAFTGVLGSLLAGNGYVPLNPGFPIVRNSQMLQRAQCRSIVVDSAGLRQLSAILERTDRDLLVILPECDSGDGLARRWPRHTFVGADELGTTSPSSGEDEPPSDDAIAYLLFTSGSTGTPKGIAVAHRSVTHFIDSMADRYAITERDRFSQTFDMTFDLSVFDMFVAWERGACVCCPSQKTMLNPVSFIQQSELSVWFSVPSVGLMMKKLGFLRPGIFPTLRWTLFCGEPLPIDVAAAWADAAPVSAVENLYGPTELTIACMAYRWNGGHSASESERNIVPIGYPLPAMKYLVADKYLNEVAPCKKGELLMAGPQLSLGYWQDSERTSLSFVVPPNCTDVYYKTGDLVRRPSNDAPMVFLGRTDTQIKVNGYRVELGEVEACLCQEAGIEVAVAVGWPVDVRGPAGVEAFVADDVDTVAIREKLKTRLPRYAVPRHIHRIRHWPLNGNGKIDRAQLLKYLESSP
jgi:amino acid adenylation domain-containing protein